MTEYNWKKQAVAKNNGDFICINSYSGYTIAILDPETPSCFLIPDASNVEVGHAILYALESSRALSVEETKKLYSRHQENYQNWITKIQSLYGYKTKNALFKKMMSCGIQLEKDNTIVIRPSWHDRLESWSGDGIHESDYVRIPADSPPEEIGAALRLAFSRCLGPKP